MSHETYDVVVVGGGPVGLAATYEVAKSGAKVIVLESNNFFNQAGSSGDLARMFRTMYTENFMADLAKDAMGLWDDLEKDAGVSLRWMTGLLNFGDPTVGKDTPEGSLMGPKDNLDRLKMRYEELNVDQIEKRYPFKNLNREYKGIFAPDNGCINVQLLLRTLLSLAKDYGAHAKQHTRVTCIEPAHGNPDVWHVNTVRHDETKVVYKTKKVIITTGAFVNHVLYPSFGINLDITIWEMVASYFNCNAGPGGTIFPSMWFQFAKDKGKRSQLFYGFPALPWGPPNVTRIAVDAASQKIRDPSQRQPCVFSPDDIRDTQEFVRNHCVGVDHTVPASTLSCLQTNVFDNMFVLDFIPHKYLKGGRKDSIVVFTAGWAMKFVPLLGRALAELALSGTSAFARDEFRLSHSRRDPKTGREIIVEGPLPDLDEPKMAALSVNDGECSGPEQASGSSLRFV